MKAVGLVWMLAALSACSGDAQENLGSLPGRVIELIHAKDWGDVWDFCADEFTAHGISKGQCQVLIPRYLSDAGYLPYVAHVTTDDQQGLDERTVTVVGVLCRGDPALANPRQIKPFRLEIRVRRDGDDWLATTATLHR